METQFLGVASINGVLSNIWETKIPLSDRGFLFGHSIFETLLVKNGKIIDWKQHYARMILSCNGALINPPDEDILLHWAKEAISENMLRSKFTAEKIQLRIIISGGNSFDLPIKRENSNFPKPNITMICRNVTGPSKEQYIDGVSLKTIPDLRAPALIDIKSCSYLYNLKALEKAKSEDYDDALFYNTHNMLTECTTANFVWFDKNYSTYTAPFKGSCLAGITLTTLIAGMKKIILCLTGKN